MAASIRKVLRRDIVIICLIAFIADNVWSLQSPTFSNYASGLGASLSLVGLLSSLAGLTQLFSSMWLGLQSDVRGRKIVIVLGLVVFSMSMFVFSLATSPWMLVPGRILFGLGTVSIFTIGAAYVGDVITVEERGLAFGLFATSMGMGATTGPFIGALIQPVVGIQGTYIWGGLLAASGAGVAWRGLSDTRLLRVGPPLIHRMPAVGSMLAILKNPNLLAACLVTLVANTSFIGLIASFFPVYLTSLSLPQTTINGMFSVRAFFSTVTRLPAAIIGARISRWFFMLVALAVMGLVALAMSFTDRIVVLSILLVCEGIAFGSVLAVGQSFVAEHSTQETRGAAIGMYSTVGSLGSTFSPLLLGIAADSWGIFAVFRLTAAVIGVGLAVIVALYVVGRRP